MLNKTKISFSKKIVASLFIFAQILGFWLFAQPAFAQAPVVCKAEVSFNIQPNTVTENQSFTMSGWVRSTQFNTQGSGDGQGYCYYGDISRSVVTNFRLFIYDYSKSPKRLIQYFDVPLKQYSNQQQGFRIANVYPNQYGFKGGDNASVAVEVVMYTPGNILSEILTKSAAVNFSVTKQMYACIAGDGKYACGIRSDLSDVPNNACLGKSAQLLDASKCGELANSATPATPGNGGVATTTQVTPGSGDRSPAAGTDILYNPLPVDNLTATLLLIAKGFLGVIAIWAAVFIIIGGFQMVMSAGNEEAVTKAKNTITWAILGLVVAILSFSIIAIVQNLFHVSVKNVETGSIINSIIEKIS